MLKRVLCGTTAQHGHRYQSSYYLPFIVCRTYQPNQYTGSAPLSESYKIFLASVFLALQGKGLVETTGIYRSIPEKHKSYINFILIWSGNILHA